MPTPATPPPRTPSRIRHPHAPGPVVGVPRRHTLELLGSTTAWWEYTGAAPSEADAADAAELPVLVAVHGFRGDHHGLEPVIDRLPGVRVIAPDLPGFGDSSPMTDASHDIAGYARWLDALLDALGLRGSAVLLGHSFGSIVVAHAVADGLPTPRLVLVNPIGAPALQGPRAVLSRLAVLYYAAAARLPARAGFELLRNRAIVRVISGAMAKTREKPLRTWIHREHDAYFSRFADRDVVLQAFTASVSHDVSEVAERIRVPTLLVAAERDDITPIEAERELQRRILDARIVEIAGVGHLIHYETPEPAAAAIRAFLAENPR